LEILAICAGLLVQGALISWLIYEHRRRNRAEVLAHTSMSELTHLNRVATAGELSASIAHEVNQLLTGIVARASDRTFQRLSHILRIDCARLGHALRIAAA
jgi:C4-dicarboxylate-specific signal transduction histidine kinase